MSEDDLKKFLEENRDRIMEAGRAAIIERITESLKWNMTGVVTETVNTFLKNEIAPEVEKYLADQKGAIVQAVCAASAQVGDELAKKMVTTAAEAISGYRGREIFKALFNA